VQNKSSNFPLKMGAVSICTFVAASELVNVLLICTTCINWTRLEIKGRSDGRRI
jgi:hypothetical protein